MKRLEQPLDPKSYSFIDGFISGGSFREYLSDAVRRSAKPVCLCLRRAAYGFRLPCTDGQGEALSGDFSGGQFSEALCANFLWSGGAPYDAIVYDNDKSIARKLEIAEACGVRYFFLEQ